MTCKLTDKKLIIAPQDPSSPPSWIPISYGYGLLYVAHPLYDALHARLYDKPCDICPDVIKKRCDEHEET